MKKFRLVRLGATDSAPRSEKKAVVYLSENVLDFIYDHCRRSNKLFLRNYRWMIDNLPSDIVGELPRGGKPKDFMPFEDYTMPGITAVISQRVVDIIKKLDNSEQKFDLKEITLQKFPGKYYLLFIPMVLDSEILYPKSVFYVYNIDDKQEFKRFMSYEDYKQASENGAFIQNYKITLPASYESWDMINMEAGVFFSERLIKEFEIQGITGYRFANGDNPFNIRFDRKFDVDRLMDFFILGKA